MHHKKEKIRLKIYQIFFFRVKLFEVSFKYLSNFIAPLVAAYGSFNIFILRSRWCFTPNLWELGDRGDRNNGVSCTPYSVALSSCIFFHLPSVSSLFSHRLHHPALIGYAYSSYIDAEIMLTYTDSSRRFLRKRMYRATPFSPSAQKLISSILWEKAPDRRHRAIPLPASWFSDHFLGCWDYFVCYLDLKIFPTFELKAPFLSHTLCTVSRLLCLLSANCSSKR